MIIYTKRRVGPVWRGDSRRRLPIVGCTLLAPPSDHKRELVMAGSRKASFGYLFAMRRTDSAFCGDTGWPRIYKRCY